MILLFPYYPIKSAIVNHYIKNYHLIIDGSNAASQCAISISSQIMTSYKII